MAMTGAHIEFGLAVKVGTTTLFYSIWSETIASGATTSQSARAADSNPLLSEGALIFRVKAPDSAEIFAAVGSTPDASVAVSTGRNNCRSHLAISETKDIPARIGDKVQIVSA